MNALLQLPIVRTLYAKGLLLVVALVPVVAGVLLAGVLEEPPAPAQPEEPPVVERSAPSLLSIRPGLEKTPLSYQADYWEQLAAGAATRVVLIGPQRVPGLVIEAGYVLTSVSAVTPEADLPPPAPAEGATEPPHPDVAAAEARPAPDEPEASEAVDAEAGDDERAPAVEASSAAEASPGLLGVDWDAGLALFELGGPATATPFTLGDEAELHPGAFAAAVTRTASGRMQITPGYVAATAPPSGAGRAGTPEISIALPDSTDVAALIDLDGGLVGGAFRHDTTIEVLSTGDLLAAVTRLRDRPFCYPILTSNLSDEIQALLGITSGIAVERVRAEAFRSEPPVVPGDVLLEWNGEPLSSVDQFEELYRGQGTGDLVAFVALRGTRRTQGSAVLPDRHCRPLPEDGSTEVPRLGMAIAWSSDAGAWEIARVTPDGPGQIAGLEAGDRILTVDGRELAERTGLRTLQRLVQRVPALVFTIERNARVRFLAVTPAET